MDKYGILRFQKRRDRLLRRPVRKRFFARGSRITKGLQDQWCLDFFWDHDQCGHAQT